METNIYNGYYAVIPASVRYDKNLKPAEKLLYGEISALCNKEGYCFAKNRYFAELYSVTQSCVSRWISNLTKLGFLEVQIIRSEKNEIIERRIYIKDINFNNSHPDKTVKTDSKKNNEDVQKGYVQNCVEGYVQKNQYPIYQKVKDNNININNIEREKEDIIFDEKNDDIPNVKIETPLENNQEIVLIKNMVETYNESCPKLPKILILNDQRIKNIKKFLKIFTIDDFKEICLKANNSKFLQGNPKTGFKANFDFLIDPTYATKVFEGFYDDVKKMTTEKGKQKKIVSFEENKRMYDDLASFYSN